MFIQETRLIKHPLISNPNPIEFLALEFKKQGVAFKGFVVSYYLDKPLINSLLQYPTLENNSLLHNAKGVKFK